MHRLRFLMATLAVSALLSWANAADANPLSLGLGKGVSASQVEGRLVEKVHRWHCQKRKGWYKGKMRRHRHPRACRNDFVHPFPPPYWGYAPRPYYGYYEWRRERRDWLWD